MEQFAIETKNVSKKFCKGYKNVIAYGINDIFASFFFRKESEIHLRNNEFFSLKNITFDIKKGDVLGIIGRNGSGKSTLLKIIAGIYYPDMGTVKIRGNVGALIGAGSGFHPMLSGRENIFLSATILGMKRKEIEKKFDSIVDFAGIGDFLDSPVKNYSTGMYARLGFAINIMCDPDILIVDEVLAVGDQEFRKKCFAKLDEIIKRKKTLIFVSHMLNEIERLCSKTLWLNSGEQMAFGQTKEVIKKYQDFIDNEEKQEKKSRYTPGK